MFAFLLSISTVQLIATGRYVLLKGFGKSNFAYYALRAKLSIEDGVAEVDSVERLVKWLFFGSILPDCFAALSFSSSSGEPLVVVDLIEIVDGGYLRAGDIVGGDPVRNVAMHEKNNTPVLLVLNQSQQLEIRYEPFTERLVRQLVFCPSDFISTPAGMKCSSWTWITSRSR